MPLIGRSGTLGFTETECGGGKIWSALIIDDDPGVRQSIRLCLEADGGRAMGVGTSAGAIEAIERGRFDVVFLDLWLGKEAGLSLLPEILRRQPDIGVIVITAFASFESAVEAMKLGAVDYLPKPFTPAQVRHAARRVVTESELKRKIGELQERIEETEGETSFETNSPVFRGFLQTVRRAAAADTVVMLRGESGTGKNVLARWIQAQSKLADRPFVTVHCPMLSGDLMTSALFGHCKGSFTGAVADTVGKVEQAEGGTLFLDEVGDLTADAQARLLRFLNDQTYERLGESKERRANVRIVGATNRPLEDAVKEGRFREDLFYRLNVIPLVIPPLRDRPEDILILRDISSVSWGVSRAAPTSSSPPLPSKRWRPMRGPATSENYAMPSSGLSSWSHRRFSKRPTWASLRSQRRPTFPPRRSWAVTFRSKCSNASISPASWPVLRRSKPRRRSWASMRRPSSGSESGTGCPDRSCRAMINFRSSLQNAGPFAGRSGNSP